MFRDGSPILEEPVLGVIGAGSGCDLVRSFGVPGDTESAAAHLVGENTYAIGPHEDHVDRSRRRAPHGVRTQPGAGGDGRAAGRVRGQGAGVARRFAALLRLLVRLPEDRRRRRFTIEHDTRTWEGRAWNVVVANAQFTGGGLRLSPRSFPGDGVLDALVFTGPRSGAYTQLPRLFRHGDHVPDPHHPGAEGEDPFRGPVRAADAGPRRRRHARDDPRQLPDRAPADTLQAVKAGPPRSTRASGRRRPRAEGWTRWSSSPSRDLAYLTGYDPMPLPRPTLLVLRPDRDPVILVPELERALAAASPIGEHLELVPWRDGSDPYEAAASLLAGADRVAVADRLWAAHLLGLQRALPGAVVLAGVFGDGAPPRREGRARAGGAPARRTRRRRDLPPGRLDVVPGPERGGRRPRSRRAARPERTRAGRLHDRGERPQRRLPASRARGTDDPAARRGRDGLRWTAGGLLQRHDPNRRGRRSTGGFRAGLRGRPGGSGGRRRRRPARTRGPGGAIGPRGRSSTRRVTANASSTGRGTASASICTNLPTWWRATARCWRPA